MNTIRIPKNIYDTIKSNLSPVEVEKGEYLQTPDGSTMEVLGNKHSQGGEMLNVPDGTKVISDYLKIGYGIEENVDPGLRGIVDPKANSKETVKLIGD